MPLEIFPVDIFVAAPMLSYMTLAAFAHCLRSLAVQWLRALRASLECLSWFQAHKLGSRDSDDLFWLPQAYTYIYIHSFIYSLLLSLTQVIHKNH